MFDKFPSTKRSHLCFGWRSNNQIPVAPHRITRSPKYNFSVGNNFLFSRKLSIWFNFLFSSECCVVCRLAWSQKFRISFSIPSWHNNNDNNHQSRLCTFMVAGLLVCWSALNQSYWFISISIFLSLIFFFWLSLLANIFFLFSSLHRIRIHLIFLSRNFTRKTRARFLFAGVFLLRIWARAVPICILCSSNG